MVERHVAMVLGSTMLFTLYAHAILEKDALMVYNFMANTITFGWLNCLSRLPNSGKEYLITERTLFMKRFKFQIIDFTSVVLSKDLDYGFV